MLNKIGLKFGLIGFGIYALYVICGWQLSLKLLINPLLSFALGLMVIGLGIYSQLAARKANGGFLDFTYTLQVYMITVLIAIMGYYLFTIVIFNFIDPAATKEMMRLSVEQSMGMMKSIFGFMGQENAMDEMPQEIMEEAMKDTPNPFGPIIIVSMVISIAFYTVVGLISAAVIRRDEPVPFH